MLHATYHYCITEFHLKLYNLILSKIKKIKFSNRKPYIEEHMLQLDLTGKLFKLKSKAAVSNCIMLHSLYAVFIYMYYMYILVYKIVATESITEHCYTIPLHKMYKQILQQCSYFILIPVGTVFQETIYRAKFTMRNI